MREVTGFDFEIGHSPGAGAVARAIASRTQRAEGWLSELFGFRPRFRLEVLDADDWSRRAEVPIYGMPHVGNENVIYVAASDSDLFDDILLLTQKHLPDDERVSFEAVYGGPPDLRPFADLLAIHELAHLYHLERGFDFGRFWLTELFCNLALEGYVLEAEPEARSVLETLPRASRHIPPSELNLWRLDNMADSTGVNYGWYELQLHAEAIPIWGEGGRDLVRTPLTSIKLRRSGMEPSALMSCIHVSLKLHSTGRREELLSHRPPTELRRRMIEPMQTNVLYYGDNLDILRRYLPDAAVDLVYLDPPFNSNRDDNVIFRDESGNATDPQLLAFEDTWHWGPSADEAP